MFDNWQNLAELRKIHIECEQYTGWTKSTRTYRSSKALPHISRNNIFIFSFHFRRECVKRVCTRTLRVATRAHIFHTFSTKIKRKREITLAYVCLKVSFTVARKVRVICVTLHIKFTYNFSKKEIYVNFLNVKSCRPKRVFSLKMRFWQHFYTGWPKITLTFRVAVKGTFTHTYTSVISHFLFILIENVWNWECAKEVCKSCACTNSCKHTLHTF